MSEGQVDVYGGVDTHRDVHVAAVVDSTGRVLGTAPFRANKAGYEQLADWLGSQDRVVRVGVEGTGSYGAGLARHLTSIGVEVMEVNRPNRQLRRRFGKTDTIDAQAAARAVLSGQATAVPKSGNGRVESIRMLTVARRSATKARTQAINQLHALVVTAPHQVRHQLERLPAKARVKTCAGFRPGTANTTNRYAKQALRSLACRYQTLTAEIKELTTQINRLCAQANPALLATPGVGADTAATLLIAAGDNPNRMHSEASFVLRCSDPPSDRETVLRCGSATVPTASCAAAWARPMSSDCLKRHIAREMRRQSRPGVLGPYRTSPSESRREPPSQQCPLADRYHSHAPAPANHLIHRETPGGRQKPKRDHPLPQKAHRTRDLPPVDQPTPNT